jgi:hypothetical protein
MLPQKQPVLVAGCITAGNICKGSGNFFGCMCAMGCTTFCQNTAEKPSVALTSNSVDWNFAKSVRAMDALSFTH